MSKSKGGAYASDPFNEPPKPEQPDPFNEPKPGQPDPFNEPEPQPGDPFNEPEPEAGQEVGFRPAEP